MKIKAVPGFSGWWQLPLWNTCSAFCALGDPQHRGSLPIPSSNLLLPSPSTALPSLLCAWIIYAFIKQLDMQVPSTVSSRTLIWATVSIYGAKMGLGIYLLCLHGFTMRCYCIVCAICLTGSSLRLFPSSLLRNKPGSSDLLLSPCVISYAVTE